MWRLENRENGSSLRQSDRNYGDIEIREREWWRLENRENGSTH